MDNESQKLAERPKLIRSEQEVATLFRHYADTWAAATMNRSNPTEIVMHPAYQKIISLGLQAIPHILKEMVEEGGEWFWALRMITDENPVTPEHEGRVRLMKQDWLEWGRTRGYVS